MARYTDAKIWLATSARSMIDLGWKIVNKEAYAGGTCGRISSRIANGHKQIEVQTDWGTTFILAEQTDGGS